MIDLHNVDAIIKTDQGTDENDKMLLQIIKQYILSVLNKSFDCKKNNHMQRYHMILFLHII